MHTSIGYQGRLKKQHKYTLSCLFFFCAFYVSLNTWKLLDLPSIILFTLSGSGEISCDGPNVIGHGRCDSFVHFSLARRTLAYESNFNLQNLEFTFYAYCINSKYHVQMTLSCLKQLKGANKRIQMAKKLLGFYPSFWLTFAKPKIIVCALKL